MRLIVYGDFNCPYSCLASSRVDVLAERGVAEAEWRAVEHDATIPTPSRPVNGELAEMFDRELAEIRGLLGTDEVFPIRRPPVQPNSAQAIAAYADAPLIEADDVRRRLFAALWFDGRDIGDSAVVEAVTGTVPTIPNERAEGWFDAWWPLERRIVPMLVLPDGYVSRGLGALRRLDELSS